MIFSKMYRKYYPVKNWQDLVLMDSKDLATLKRWVNHFYIEMELNVKLRLRGIPCDRVWLHEPFFQRNYDKLKKVLFSDEELFELEDEGAMQILNAVLYRHKYNVVFSFFICPILPDDKY